MLSFSIYSHNCWRQKCHAELGEISDQESDWAVCFWKFEIHTHRSGYRFSHLSSTLKPDNWLQNNACLMCVLLEQLQLSATFTRMVQKVMCASCCIPHLVWVRHGKRRGSVQSAWVASVQGSHKCHFSLSMVFGQAHFLESISMCATWETYVQHVSGSPWGRKLMCKDCKGLRSGGL